MKKFNSKVYQGKNRIYLPVFGAFNIQKVLVWDDEKSEYKPPARGKMYCARRYEVDRHGQKVRKSAYFASLEEARNWQAFIISQNDLEQVNQPALKSSKGLTFKDIVLEWKARKFPGLRRGSRVHYDGIIERHFQMLMDYPINAITSKDIDSWLADRKSNLGDPRNAKRRASFVGELDVLKILFHYYVEYHDEDPTFRYPIKKRHLKDAYLNVSRPTKKKDLTEGEFQRFKNELVKLEDGLILSKLATVQYYEALRISEAAAMEWSNVSLNRTSPKDSRIQIDQHVEYRYEKGGVPKVEPGFKNSNSCGGVKELPLFPPAFHVLMELHRDGKSGFIFPNQDGDFFKYHVVRARYNRAFKMAGLPYIATHVLRHGWTREVLDDTNGDFAVAGQLLGNNDRESINTYAKRNKSAIVKVAHRKWDEVNQNDVS